MWGLGYFVKEGGKVEKGKKKVVRLLIYYLLSFGRDVVVELLFDGVFGSFFCYYVVSKFYLMLIYGR